MRYLLVILSLTCIYAGCLPRSEPRIRPSPSRVAASPGAVIRVAVRDHRDAEALVLSAVGAPLVRFTPAPGGGQEASARCGLFSVGSALDPDGRAISADTILADWERRRADPARDPGWLLAGFDAVAGPDVSPDACLGRPDCGTTVALCFDPRQPVDLDQRLSHRDLWLWSEDPVTGLRVGPGPFMESRAHVLRANPEHPQTAWPERVEVVVTPDPALLYRVGQAEVVLVHGRDAARLFDEQAPNDVELVRLETWDTVYALWLNPSARWVNDPRLRRWLAGQIDREGMVRYLFDGRAEAAFTLLPDSGKGEWDPVVDRPLSGTSRPRLTLRYDAGDPDADRIASRLRGELLALGIRLALLPRPQGVLYREIRDGVCSLALIAHRPLLVDPALALWETFSRLGQGAEPAMGLLESAASFKDSARDADDAKRREGALAAERALTFNAQLIPLVRVEAWLAHRAGLVGIETGPPGVLRLERAGWRR